MNYICDIEIGINDHSSKQYYYEEGQSRPQEPTYIIENDPEIRMHASKQGDDTFPVVFIRDKDNVGVTINYTLNTNAEVAKEIGLSPTCEVITN